MNKFASPQEIDKPIRSLLMFKAPRLFWDYNRTISIW